MQQDLIAEEFKEFIDACANEPYENELKELADLVYVCFQYAENMEWDLEIYMLVEKRTSLLYVMLISNNQHRHLKNIPKQKYIRISEKCLKNKRILMLLLLPHLITIML